MIISKRIVGPLIKDMIGDTLTIYSNTVFDCGQYNKNIKDLIFVIIKAEFNP